jgi:hypothetical protein
MFCVRDFGKVWFWLDAKYIDLGCTLYLDLDGTKLNLPKQLLLWFSKGVLLYEYCVVHCSLSRQGYIYNVSETASFSFIRCNHSIDRLAVCTWLIVVGSFPLLNLMSETGPFSETLLIYLWLYSALLDLCSFFSFLILYTVGGTPWTVDQPVTRLLPAHRTTQTQIAHTQTFMPWVGFETMITAFKRAKIVRALDRAATVISQTQLIGLSCILQTMGSGQHNIGFQWMHSVVLTI